MIAEINKDVVYVKGAKNGAIYDLNTGIVYSINSASCSVIDKQLCHTKLSIQEQKYIDMLIANHLIDTSFDFQVYKPEITNDSLEMCWLEITQLCNCKCLHCYEGENHVKSDKSLSLEDWFRVIDQIKSNGVQRVVVIGGEPCLHKKIIDIVSYLASKKIDVTIFSNGTCLSNELMEVISKNKIRFKCSLYGHTAEVHDTITQRPGSFQQLMRSIKYFKEHGVDVSIAVVLMKENEKYFDDILSFTKSLELKCKYDVIRQVFGGKQSIHKPENTTIIRSVMRTSPNFKRVDKKKFDFAMQRNTCWNGKFAVCEDGNVIPCVFERNISYGNVKENSIDEILSSDNLQKCWRCTMEQINYCKDCEFRFACKDCRPLAASCGNYMEKNPRCTYDVYNGEWNE